MEFGDEWKSKSDEELENGFLQALSDKTLPGVFMRKLLAALAEAGRSEVAESLADLAQDSLAERGDVESSLELLMLRAAWHPQDAACRRICHVAAAKVLSDRQGKAFVASVGFTDGVVLTECLRRLHILTRLRSGVLCRDRTWGFGVVRGLDAFYGKVTVDFSAKPGHQMSFAYAAETLELIGEEHLQARQYRDPQGMARLAADDPAEVVRLALRSYGELSAPLLKEALVPGIVTEDGWKAFWDGARKGLKQDPLVDMPSRRNDPIRLRARPQVFDAEWLGALKAEKDADRVVEMIARLEREEAAAGLSGEAREIIGQRLAFVIWAAGRQRPDMAASALLCAERLNCLSSELDGDRAAEELLELERFLGAVTGMPARDIEPFLARLAQRDGDALARRVRECFPSMPMNVAAAALELLIRLGRLAECADWIRDAVAANGGACIQLICWLCRHFDRMPGWTSAEHKDLMLTAVDALESDCSAERLKAQHQLRKLFASKEWLETSFSRLEGVWRAAVLERICRSRGWDPSERRSVIARIIRLYPELTSVVTDETPRVPAVTQPARLTSWRSYRERQEQLRRLVEEAIPQNSRDIGIARSYGDLRENFEYQAARDQQRLLLQREAELKHDLAEVRASDFANAPTDRVGPGVCVVLRRPGGDPVRYCVLGEWDRDPALGIIASRSRVAELVMGCKVGDGVGLPSDAGDGTGADEACVIQEITGLTDEIRRWMNGGMS